MVAETLTAEEREREKQALRSVLLNLRVRLEQVEADCVDNDHIRSALLILAESYLAQIEALERACNRAHAAGLQKARSAFEGDAGNG